MIKTETPEGDATIEYEADTGHIERQTSASGIQQIFNYDGPITIVSAQPGIANAHLLYEYDDLLRASGITVAGATTNFTYDSDSLLTSAGALSIERRSDNGLISGTTLQNLTTSNAYNTYGEPSEENADLPGTAQFNLTYQRDAAGRITRRAETTPSGQTTWEYEYDQRGRVQAAFKDSQPYATYTYDANGNRVAQTTGGDQITATFDNRDRMRTQGHFEFSYNKNGEMTARENTATNQTATFSYDTFGNLTGATTEDGQQITYKLDSDANRATREVNGQLQSRYVYAQGIQGPVVELAGDNSVKARFIYGTRSIVPDYMVKNGNTYRLLTDQLGSVRLVVDASSGAVAQEIEYDPFGVVIRDTNEGFQPFGFAGGLYDSATGLTHFGAREYSAGMGRWTAADPISFEGDDANLYGYVLADPVNLVDPSGRIPFPYPGQPVMNGIRRAANALRPDIGNRCGRSFGDRFSSNFVATNRSVIGILAPTGSGLLTGSKFARATGQVPFLEYLLRTVESPGQIRALLQASPRLAVTGAANFLAVGAAWEAGVAIGSAISAAYICGCP